MLRTTLTFVVLMLCGCNTIVEDREALRDQDEPCAAPSTALVKGSIRTTPAAQPVNQDLRIRGDARHEGNLAIRRVLVAGIVADNEGFNFDSWSVLIPIEVILDLRSPPSNEVTVEAFAIDACGREFSLDKLTFQAEPPAGLHEE